MIGIREYIIASLVLILAGLGWYARYETEQAGAEKSAKLTAERIAKNNAEQIDVLQKAIIQREAETAKQLQKEASGRKRAEAIIEEINHAEDGPLSPALSVAIERLRDGDRTSGNEGDKGLSVTFPNGSGK